MTTMEGNRVGLIGGTSFVGHQLFPLLEKQGYNVISFSRSDIDDFLAKVPKKKKSKIIINEWICLAPI